MSKIDTPIAAEGSKLKQKIEAACYDRDPVTGERIRIMDAQSAYLRATGEEVLRGILTEIKSEPLVKGGYVYPQQLRETADIDLLYMREIEPWEIERAFSRMKPVLAAKGMDLTSFDANPRELNANGQAVHRYSFVIKVGTSDLKNHLDLSFGGRASFPKHNKAKAFGTTFYSGQQPVLAHYQTLESQAADKMAAILDPKTTRWKDFSDLAMLRLMGLETQIIADELIHKLAMKYGNSASEVMASLEELPESLTYDYAEEKAATYEKWSSKAGPSRKKDQFLDILGDVRELYTVVRHKIGWARIRATEGTVNPTIADVKRAFAQAQAVKDQGKRVVDLADYRLKSGSDISSRM